MAETLDYRCNRPTSQADYLLKVRYSLERANSEPSILFEYELSEDERTVALWIDELHWNETKFAFVPSETSTGGEDPLSDSIQKEIARVRKFALTNPLDPEKDSYSWIGESGLMDVLIPVCDK